jgi:hypothetical protein
MLIHGWAPPTLRPSRSRSSARRSAEVCLRYESAATRPRSDDQAASFLTLDLVTAADDAPSSDSPYPTSRTMRSFNG